MKKKIAVFVNGWNFENVYRFEQALLNYAPKNSMDFFTFSWNATGPDNKYDQSRSTIFDLPDLSRFDALIIYNPGSNLIYKTDHVHSLAKKAGIPTISVGRKNPDFYYLGVDNYIGTKELADHLLNVHNVRDIKFIAGHPTNEDSNIRIQAVKESFKEHGIPFDEDCIFYSDWRVDFTTEFITKVITEEKQLPDAFICANDYIAEAVSFTLTSHGYKIPDDCIVTGFDYLEESQVFYPSVASVDQRYETLGETVSHLLSQIFGNVDADRETIVNCKFRPGESCGCKNSKNENLSRIKFCSSIIKTRQNENEIDIAIEKLERAFIEADDYNDMLVRCRQSFYETHGCEGENFYLMLDTAFTKMSEKNLDDIPKYQFADKMTVVIGKTDGIPSKQNVIDTSQLIPDYTGEGPNHSYFIIPIYYESYVCGYMVFVDRLFWLTSKTFIRFENHMTQAIIVYRRNVQLTYLNNVLSELMEKDPLTSVKNRTAFERYIENQEREYSANRNSFDPFAAVFFDINDLKVINDTLGHEQGDEYINNCCHLICSVYKHSPVFRVGGDEFVTILHGEDYIARDLLLNQLKQQMDATKKTDYIYASPTDNISIASGMSTIDKEKDTSIRLVLKRADEAMYENKRLMKSQK